MPATGKRPPGRPRSLPIAEQRRAILEAARRVFAAYDFQGASIERVAKEANVARPLVYELFGGKGELFIAVVDDAVEQLIADMAGAAGPGDVSFPAEPGVEDREVLFRVVRNNVAALFSFIARRPEAAAIIRIAEYGGFGPAKSEVVAGRSRIEDGLADLFAATWTPPPISREAARVLALMTLSMVEAVGFRQPSEPAWDPDETIDLITTFLVGALTELEAEHDLLRSFGRGT